MPTRAAVAGWVDRSRAAATPEAGPFDRRIGSPLKLGRLRGSSRRLALGPTLRGLTSDTDQPRPTAPGRARHAPASPAAPCARVAPAMRPRRRPRHAPASRPPCARVAGRAMPRARPRPRRARHAPASPAAREPRAQVVSAVAQDSVVPRLGRMNRSSDQLAIQVSPLLSSRRRSPSPCVSRAWLI
jgi:hypothetical protein